MSGGELLEVARGAMALAQKLGASDAAATASRSRDVETTWRDGKLEKIADATSRSVSLGLFVDGRWGAMSTSDLRPDGLERFVENAIAMVRSLAKDPHRKLPDPSLYAGRSGADLEMFDAAVAGLTTDARLVRAKAMEDGARSAPGADRIASVTTSFSDSESHSARVATNGFEGTLRSTSVTIEAEVSVKDADGRRPEDWASASVRFIGDLPEAASVGREATARALQRLGAKKVPSGSMKVLVEARAARTLLRHLTSPLAGGSLQQKESFFEGKMGSTIASSSLTLTDDPLLRRGLGSRPFDGEGIAGRSRKLVEAGVLRSYLLDVYYASKLGVPATTGRTTNLVVVPGHSSLAALRNEMKDGVFVTSFLGGNSNTTTGVFSLGISGFRVVGGELREPISEMNIAGNHLEFWKRLAAVGDDPYPYSSTRCPSLLFTAVSVAGA